jgi:hypothetical protein
LITIGIDALTAVRKAQVVANFMNLSTHFDTPIIIVDGKPPIDESYEGRQTHIVYEIHVLRIGVNESFHVITVILAHTICDPMYG